MLGEFKRKLAIILIGVVVVGGAGYLGGIKLGWWNQFGSGRGVTIIDVGAEAKAGRLENLDSSATVPGSPASTSASENTTLAAGTLPTAGGETIVVHVVGAVNKPGVYTLPKGARIFQAVEQAGAAKQAALGFINLAQTAQDGEQIVVPSLAEVAVPAGSKSSAVGGGTSGSGRSAGTSRLSRASTNQAGSGLVNLNLANQQQLDTLPGIGPAMAQRIITFRQTNGPFKSVQDLQKVSGIGTKKFQELAGRVCI